MNGTKTDVFPLLFLFILLATLECCGNRDVKVPRGSLPSTFHGCERTIFKMKSRGGMRWMEIWMEWNAKHPWLNEEDCLGMGVLGIGIWKSLMDLYHESFVDADVWKKKITVISVWMDGGYHVDSWSQIIIVALVCV